MLFCSFMQPQGQEEGMDKQQRRKTLTHFVARMHEGQSWQEAARATGLAISQSTAYRLSQAVRKRGQVALQDGRHGHPIKLRGEARTFLEDACRQAPRTPSSVIQTQLHERFDVSVSISQINRVRAALGVSNHPHSPVQGKNRGKRGSLPSRRMARRCRQSAFTGRCPSNGPAHDTANGPSAPPAHR